MIDDITTRLLLLNSDKSIIASALISLAAALKRLDAIRALACVSFIRAWRSELDNWQCRVASLPMLGDVRDAAKFLELLIR